MRIRTLTTLAATLIAALSLGFLATACEGTETADDSSDAVRVTVGALEAEGESQALGMLPFAGAAAGMTAEERVEAFKAWVGEHLTCGEVTTSGAIAELTFTKDCAWEGRRWTGTVSVEFAADGSAASMTMSGLAVNGATTTGTIEVARVGDRHVTVAADRETHRASGRVVVGSWDAEYSWDDVAYTVVSSVHEVEIDGYTSTLSKTGVVWERQEILPQAGVVTFTGFRGRTWTMTFSDNGDGTVTVTLETLRGTRQWVVDSDGVPSEV